VRIICGLVGLAAAGFLAASAHGLGVPTVSTPTLTAPSVSVPSLPAPTLPATLPKPTLPAPTAPTPTVTTAPLPAPTAPKPTLPSTTLASPTPPPATTAPKTTAPVPAPAPATSAAPSTSAGATSGAQAAGTAPANGSRAAAAPRRSSGVAGASHTTRRGLARFTLKRPAHVRISIEELAPVCRKLRTYVVRLPKGTHAFRFPVTHATEIGTYRVTALVRGHTIFSVRARRMHERVKLGGTANVCGQPTTRTAFSLSSLDTLGATGFPATAGQGGSGGQLHVKAAHGRRSASPQTSGAQAPEKNPLVRAVSLTDAPRSLQPLLFTLLAIAIALLALAAAPQRVLPAGRAAAIVATRRAYFAAAGIWLLVVVAIVTAFS
jgi:hypothetical protein